MVINRLILFLFLQFFLVNYSLADDLNCHKNNVLKLYKTAIATIESNTTKITDYLQGNSKGDFSPSLLFGPDFDFLKSEEKKKEFKKIINEQDGIIIEYKNLYSCLGELNKSKQVEELKSKSKKLIEYKIELLERNEILNDSLRKSDLAQNELPSLQNQIISQNKETSIQRAKLESELLIEENKLSKNKDTLDKELTTYKNSLTKVRIELLSKKIDYNKSLSEKIDYFQSSSKKMSTIASDLTNSSHNTLVKRFEEVQNLWLMFSKENFYDLFKSKLTLNLPEIPGRISLLNKDNPSVEVQAILAERAELIVIKQSIVEEYTLKKKKELRLLNQLIVSCNQLRSSYYRRLGHSYLFSNIFTKETLLVFKNEILSSPYRIISYFYSYYLYLIEQISKGRVGYLNISKDFLKYLFIFFLLAALGTLFNRFNEFFDKHIQKFLAKYYRIHFFKLLMSFWNRLKDNSVTVLWLVLLEIIDRLNILSELNYIIVVVKVFLFSKILKSLIILFLGNVSTLDNTSFLRFKKKASQTSDRFKNIFLFYSLIMIFIEATIGSVYLYTIVNTIVLLYSLYQMVKESSQWEDEFTVYVEKKFSGLIVNNIFKLLKLFPNIMKASVLLCFILILTLFDLFISLTENFDISKKVSANLFKKQIERIEASEDSTEKISTEYKDLFKLHSIDESRDYIKTLDDVEQSFIDEFDEWHSEKSDEHSFVIYGDKGVGKTSFLKHVCTTIESSYEVEQIYVKMPSKTVKRSEIYKFIQEQLAPDLEMEKFDLYQIDSSLEKKVLIVLDEAQNIFLSYTGGFEAYYAFTSMINLNTKNIYWALSFNKYSWFYLDRAFGRTQFFRNVFQLKGWTDNKIKELILTRHNKSEYKLSFDLLISATKSQDELDRYSSIESKFFKLLWELSRGNPRSALYLWMTSLSLKNKSTFNVNVPRVHDFSGMESISDDLMFVIAHILKHENLSTSEIEKVTNLPRGIVRNAIRQGLERRFLHVDDRRRYMVDISTQYGLIKYLKEKNFIYGS